MNDEPQSATDYDDRTSAAVRSVLVEIGQTLGSFRGKFAVIGGAVPWLLLKDSEMRHVGTLDIDLSLDAQALAAGDEYVALVDALHGQGYAARDTLKYFQMVRTVPRRNVARQHPQRRPSSSHRLVKITRLRERQADR